MQTTRRERLMRMTSDASAYGVATVVQFGVCISFLALLTVIALTTSVNDAATLATASTAQQKESARVGGRAEAHRKQVFDERRAQFEGTAPTQLALSPDRGGSMDIIAP